MTGDLDAVLASIDGALADDELPDAMRWSPEPGTVEQDPRLLRFDGSIVPQPPQEYEELLVLRPLTMSEANAWALRAERSPAEHEEALRQLRELFAPAAEAIAGLVDAFGRIAADAGLRFSEVIEAIGKATSATEHLSIPPPLRLRTEDPKGYALALRQSRGTGPDRQVQHRPRPRRHT